MDENKIKEVFSDEAFVKELLAMGSALDVQAALKGKGIDMSEKDILALKDSLTKSGEGDELSLGELDEAAGGMGITAYTAEQIKGLIEKIGGVNDPLRPGINPPGIKINPTW